MSDEQQVESGPDLNALRNNLPIGETVVWRIAAFHLLPDGKAAVAALVSEAPYDVDVDVCTLDPESAELAKGIEARFTRTEDGQLVVKA
jgi:hypothetical protein